MDEERALEEQVRKVVQELVPLPDPTITERLYRFGLSSGMGEYILDSLGFIARNFDPRTVQGVYEMFDHGNALPPEMVAAAVYIQYEVTSECAAEMAQNLMLMGFHFPDSADELSPLALCTIIEDGNKYEVPTQVFGSFKPEEAYRCAKEYALAHSCKVSDALRNLSLGWENKLEFGSDPMILDDFNAHMYEVMDNIFDQCSAVAARITFDVDQDQVTTKYNPRWLEQQAEYASRYFSVFHVTEQGTEEWFLEERDMKLLNVARELSTYIAEKEDGLQSRFADTFPNRRVLASAKFEQYVEEWRDNTGRVTGAFAIDLDRGEFSTLNIMDRWVAYSTKDICDAASQAFQKQDMSEHNRWCCLLDWLNGREITADPAPVPLDTPEQPGGPELGMQMKRT